MRQLLRRKDGLILAFTISRALLIMSRVEEEKSSLEVDLTQGLKREMKNFLDLELTMIMIMKA
jgi:hypothetical protein